MGEGIEDVSRAGGGGGMKEVVRGIRKLGRGIRKLVGRGREEE